MGSPSPWMPPWDYPQDALGNPSQVTLDGPGLGGNSEARVHPQTAGLGYILGKILWCPQDPAPLLLHAGTSEPQLLLSSLGAAPKAGGLPSTHRQLMLIHTVPLLTAVFTPLAEASAPVCR